MPRRGNAGVVFDLAVPGDQIVGILEQLPEGAAVLIQKPMGHDLAEARRILDCCTARQPDGGDEFPAPVQSRHARAPRS